MFAGPLPGGADLVCLIRVLYDHGRERCLTVLRNVRESLPPDGTLLIAEPMAATPGAETVGAAYFGLYLLAMKGGESRSAEDIGELAQSVGFSSVGPVRTRNPLLTSLLVAKP